MPASLIILGGGPIGIELGQAYARLGVTVTIVEMLGTILPREEPELASLIQTTLVSEGIRMLCNYKAVKCSRSGNGVAVIVETPTKQWQALSADALLVALGRTGLARARIGAGEALAISLAANGFSAGVGLFL